MFRINVASGFVGGRREEAAGSSAGADLSVNEAALREGVA